MKIQGKLFNDTKKIGNTRKLPMTRHKDTNSHNVNIKVVSGIKNNKYNNMEKINGIDLKRKELEYGGLYDTTLQLYLVKFANLSFSMWAVTTDGLRKALQHPEGKNQAPIVYRVKEWGLPKFEKMTQKELKAYK